MLAVAHWVAAWPGATQAVGAWPLAALALVVAGGIWIALWQSPWRWLGAPAIAVGLALSFTVQPPDVIIAGDGDNVAVRDAAGDLHLLSSRRGRFDAEMWLRRDGDPREIADVNDTPGGFSCDSAGCLAHLRDRPDKVLLVAHSPAAIAEDCAGATIVVAEVRGWTLPCAGPQLVVTPRLLADEGAIEAHLAADRIEWTTVARERGDRPWTKRAAAGR
jgi:competence protein ComEC